MTEDVRQKILKWILDNHQHHAHEDIEVPDKSGYYDEVWSDCEDASYPYVNSLDLEKFIKEI